MLGIIYHKKQVYDTAQIYYQAVADLKPNWGYPYLQIGKMYVSKIPECAKNDSFQAGVIICAALDMWEKAKTVDPSLIKEANQLIEKYKKDIPTNEDAFQRGVKEGDVINVPCLDGVKTKLRLRRV